MRRRLPLIAVVSLLLALSVLTGCAKEPYLRPAAGVDRLVDRGIGAVATENGMRMEARVRAWEWSPRDLEKRLTPVLITLENNGDRQLRIRYEDFQLVSPGGLAYAALPPYEIRGQVRESIGSYPYSVDGFYVAPHLQPYHPYWSPYRPFYYHPYYYTTYHRVYRTYNLPTREMLVRALPEGVLEPGGRVTGFVYFADLDTVRDHPDRLDLVFELVDAETQETIGTIAIPFDVVRE